MTQGTLEVPRGRTNVRWLRELCWWVLFGVALGLLPLLLQFGDLWLHDEGPDMKALLISGALALPSVSIAAGALAQQVIRCGIRGDSAWDLVLFAVVLFIILMATLLYASHHAATPKEAERLASEKLDLDRLAAAYGLVFVEAVLGGAGCIYRSFAVGLAPPSDVRRLS